MKRKIAIILMVLTILIGSISGVAGAANSENTASPTRLRLIEATIDEKIAGNVIVQADAKDDKGLTAVAYRIDSGESIPMTMVSGNALSGIWEAAWDTTTADDGAHSITVIATDSGNQSSEPYQVEVDVDNIDEPPQIISVIILTPTPTPTPIPTPAAINWNNGDSWTWRVYYNSQEATPVINTKNQSHTVDAMGVTTDVIPTPGATPIQVGPCCHVNITFESGSIRRADSQTVYGIRSATDITAEGWFNESNLALAEQHAFTQSDFGQVEAWEYYTSPDTTYWYPFSIGQSWNVHKFRKAVCQGSTFNFGWDFTVEVAGYIEDYDLSTCSPDVVGTGVYDVYYIRYYSAGSSEPVIEEWFSPEVKNIVRRVDHSSFAGFEDRVLMDYSITE